MVEACFIAGDWGTSHLRLFLCDQQGGALDSARGPGAAQTAGRFAETFASLTEVWQARHGALPVILCGMAGSNIGWRETPYAHCPVRLDSLADACVNLPGRVRIVPGLACRNPFGAPDFMRGEETQILGALHLAPALGQGRRLLCLPGTHTKWVVLDQGVICEFLTSATGELFALLREHSVLIRDTRSAGEPIDAQAFAQGLDAFGNRPHAQLVHRLFECRARQLSGAMTPHGASGYLSGLCIASDLRGAMDVFPAHADAKPVGLIGTSELSQLYAAAFARQGREVLAVEGTAASLAGLARIQSRFMPGPTDAS